MERDNLFGIFNEMLSSLVHFLPKVVAFLTIVIFGWIIARFISKVLFKFFSKLNVNRLTEGLQDITFISKSNINFDLAKLLSLATYYFIYFIFLMAGVEVLGIEALSELFKNFIHYLPNLFVAGIILIVGLLLANMVRKAIMTATDSLGIPSGRLIASFAFYFLVINVFIVALGQAKIETGFLASNISYVFAGGIFAFALGYGIASKDTVSNYLASFYTKDKINIGDDVQIGSQRGVIVDIDKSSITLKTSQGKTILPLRKLNFENIEILNS